MADLVVPEAVRVGRVQQRHPGVESGVHGAHRALAVRPALDGQGHAAQADGADAAVGQGALLHGFSSRR